MTNGQNSFPCMSQISLKIVGSKHTLPSILQVNENLRTGKSRNYDCNSRGITTEKTKNG